MDKCCLIVATPYHALNAANLLLSGVVGNLYGQEVDLYFNRRFVGWEGLLRRFLERFEFRNTYTYAELYPVGGGFGRNIECTIGAITPRLYISSISKTYHKGEYKKRNTYSTIITGWYTNFSIGMMLSNRNASVVLYDDGIGSYKKGSFNIFDKRKKLFKLLGRQFPDVSPNAVYLNNPEYSMVEFGVAPSQIPQPSTEEWWNVINDLFSFDRQSEYDSKRIVYVSEPRLGKTPSVTTLDVERIIIQWDNEVICRLHPREDMPDSYSFSHIDRSLQSWELLSFNQLTNNHVLVGRLSTAQFVPKLLADVEPWVIFTYPLFSKGIMQEQDIERNNMVMLLKSIYSKPEKIIVTKNLRELDSQLQSIIKTTQFYDGTKVS